MLAKPTGRSGAESTGSNHRPVVFQRARKERAVREPIAACEIAHGSQTLDSRERLTDDLVRLYNEDNR